MRILFLIPYPLHQAPSQRFRFEQYLQILEINGHSFETQSFFTSKYRLTSSQGARPGMVWTLLYGFIRRFIALFKLHAFDFVFIHRETYPIGPPFFEWIIAKWARKRIIYDFDDAIWLTDNLHESTLQRWIRYRGKVARICRWSYRISCGNQYLLDFASHFNPRTSINPTTIDLENYKERPLKNNGSEVIVGWTGTHSTIKYLRSLEPVFRRLFHRFPQLKLKVIADIDPALSWGPVTFHSWRRESEGQDLATFDIGIMPLPDNAWTRGKCGAKVLQYMAAQVPCVASRVGANPSIINHAEDGYLCATETEWFEVLERLIRDSDLRKNIGSKGRSKVEKYYSSKSNASNFLAFFN